MHDAFPANDPAFLERILDRLPDPVFVKDKHHRYILINRAFCAFVGHDRQTLLGLSDYDYSCTYAILESPMGVENYVATLKLTPITETDQTFAEWTASFDCAPEREEALVRQIGQDVFAAGFRSLDAMVARAA
ncbi:MAG: PAS domain-containing protein [Acidobacteriota bacterium]